ncbi:MAG: hypothetical protein VX690_06090, partial [Pseudomonadota bacterium]|nr:hypothetical protein [Pseudomonadota bacterium]
MQRESKNPPENISLRNRLLSRTGPLRNLAITVAVGGALFNIIGLNLYPVDAFVLRSTFLFVTSVVGFIIYPFRKNDRGQVEV